MSNIGKVILNLFQDLIAFDNRPRKKLGVTTLFMEHSENTGQEWHQ